MIKLVEKKLQDCHSSLASLKQVATELNKDYQSMETKVSNLGSSFKEISLSSSPSPLITAAVASASSSSLSGVSRSSSLSSIVDGSSEESRQSSEQDSSSSEELEDLVDSYVIIKRNSDGTATIQPTNTTTSLNQKKARYSIGSGSSTSSTELSSSDSDAEIPNDSGERYNNYLIKMLLERS